MKFEKFVKQLGGQGVIQTYGADKWLVSASAMMKIPDGMSGIIAESINEMPPTIKSVLDRECTGVSAVLSQAILPYGDSAIKDCVRIFRADENPKLKLPISNDDYSLIDLRKDEVEILTRYDVEEEEFSVVALLVKKPYLADDSELVGVIFPLADWLDKV